MLLVRRHFPLAIREDRATFSIVMNRGTYLVLQRATTPRSIPMNNLPAITILCLSSYEKGQEFLRECKRQGYHVILLTVTELEHANWPRESIDELYFMPDLAKVDDVIKGVSFLARTRAIERIVGLDDYDVWTAAALREHLRVPGMGDTTVRYFRDKLAMRLKAQEHGIPVPDFVPILNYD